jgi:endonuclease YncB( thermonuclease family)
MPKPRYTVIQGAFRIHNPIHPLQGPQPDGDTIRFEPNDVQLVRRLRRISGTPPDIRSGGINVRYEGIDALETHFQQWHQDTGLAFAARDKNLALIGYTHVTFFPDHPSNVSAVDIDPLPGYVIANGIEANGRLLGLVYAGKPSEDDGKPIFVDEALLDRSVNAQIVQAGLAYVEPYDTMPMTLVERMRTLVREARDAQIGIFAAESVSIGKSAKIGSIDDAQTLVLWPKLFRRLASYFAEGNMGLADFDLWVRDDPVRRDDSLRLPDGEAANLHDTYDITGNDLSLKYNPEDLLIVPDPAV